MVPLVTSTRRQTGIFKDLIHLKSSVLVSDDLWTYDVTDMKARKCQKMWRLFRVEGFHQEDELCPALNQEKPVISE